MKNILIVILLLVGVILMFPMRSVGSTLCEAKYEVDSVIESDSLVVYYFNEECIRQDSAIKMLLEDKVVAYPERDSRTAIKLFGEKARHGVIFLQYKEEEYEEL